MPWLFSSSRRVVAQGILTIFTELTREMMNSVGPVMASNSGSAMTLHCTENLQSGEARTRASSVPLTAWPPLPETIYI